MRPAISKIVTSISSTQGQHFRRSLWRRGAFVSLVVILMFAAIAVPSFGRPSATPQNLSSNSISGVRSVIGLENIKPGVKGTLTSLRTGLEFTSGKANAEIPISSIQDIFTGQESRQDVGGMKGTLVEAAIPYGGGRVVSLFSHKVDVLTVEYTDSNGGFHGAIFVLSPGKATAFKNELIAQGAKVSTHMSEPESQEKK